MAIYKFTLSQKVVVQAADEEAGRQVVLASQYELDWFDSHVLLDAEITDESELSGGWDGNCYPYGGNGRTRLKDLLRGG